jgi:hypothetical protein
MGGSQALRASSRCDDSQVSKARSIRQAQDRLWGTRCMGDAESIGTEAGPSAALRDDKQ